MDAVCLKCDMALSAIPASISMNAPSNPSQVSAVGRSTMEKSVFSRFSFKYPFKSLWPSRYNVLAGRGIQEQEEEKKETESGVMEAEGHNRNSLFNSMWMEEQGNVKDVGNDHEECDGCRVDKDDEAEIQFNRDSFSRMLQRVSLADARFYAQMSYLGNLAYSIPQIKSENLLRYYNLRFVTSSMEKMMEMATAATGDNGEIENNEKKEGERNDKKNRVSASASAAYQVAASAASYLHAQTKTILPFNFSKDEVEDAASAEGSNANDSLVAAKDEVKQAVAHDLNSSPCQWYICDDDQTGTRFFIIQGSESLASWQANILFEPIQFEGFDVLVHRGIYEAAKGIYQHMLPEIHAHIESQGTCATFRFTGHSLGGSLALLVNLMLLIRREVPFSSLLPVITFGAPFIMCGGDSLLDKLGLPRSHVQAITMHRDIVSRAFACNYPNHVTELLKVVYGNLRNHSCLTNQKILYAPMGEFLILQPDDKFSPHHPLLPPGCGLYVLSDHLRECKNARKQVQDAQLVFLNSPHPLEILSERSAYGSRGSIVRDHDMKSYLKSIRTVIRQQLNNIRKARRGHRDKEWWPLSFNVGRGILGTGKQSCKWLSSKKRKAIQQEKTSQAKQKSLLDYFQEKTLRKVGPSLGIVGSWLSMYTSPVSPLRGICSKDS
ncbi:phospholipase A1 PLIP2, chloroplastic-like [Senna tora]|uniref:Phospholipase A1 PLIP2, chloroplastic-like n=1 Tax=Senna tora TaxID=362788 RepID=A0A834TAT1_9FABA|nr:phospholipase A1 PLIP2, chloroplastic-like [Senna tora]